MKRAITCPHCGHEVFQYRNPLPTTDIIIRVAGGIVLINRKNPPYGWAIPGGFIDYGESAEAAAVREAMEETSLAVTDLELVGVYSDPHRDPRHHTLTVVFTARCEGVPRAADDALELGVFTQNNLPSPLAFDHAKILMDFFSSKRW
ncbi:MAG: NUDIX hydrolase [Desulfomonile tiedjei]|nr:NUDIX hydrolase [Desulfomonile tiedjei]